MVLLRASSARVPTGKEGFAGKASTHTVQTIFLAWFQVPGSQLKEKLIQGFDPWTLNREPKTLIGYVVYDFRSIVNPDELLPKIEPRLFFVSWLRLSWYYANDNDATIVHGSAGGVDDAASPAGGVVASRSELGVGFFQLGTVRRKRTV